MRQKKSEESCQQFLSAFQKSTWITLQDQSSKAFSYYMIDTLWDRVSEREREREKAQWGFCLILDIHVLTTAKMV